MDTVTIREIQDSFDSLYRRLSEVVEGTTITGLSSFITEFEDDDTTSMIGVGSLFDSMKVIHSMRYFGTHFVGDSLTSEGITIELSHINEGIGGNILYLYHIEAAVYVFYRVLKDRLDDGAGYVVERAEEYQKLVDEWRQIKRVLEFLVSIEE